MKIRERAAAPLLEMIISIMILAFAGVVTLGIFLSARYTGILSSDKTNAMYKVQNAIEMAENKDFTQYFDENWQECDENNAVFALNVTGNEKDGLYEGVASCVKTEAYPFLKAGSEKLCTIDFGRAIR